jgi:hypothetical protein
MNGASFVENAAHGVDLVEIGRVGTKHGADLCGEVI